MKSKKKNEKLLAININLFVKNYDELHFCHQVSSVAYAFFLGGGENSHMKITGMFVVSLRGNSARVVSA